MDSNPKSHFYAVLSRMKHISRWGLMRNTRPENLEEHSYEVAVLAHALAVLRNRRFGGSVDISAVVLSALYHDASEIYTGDLPTPVKYFNQEIINAYRQVEHIASEKLLSFLPDDLRPEYEPLLLPRRDEQIEKLIKAADKLSALIKCIEEEKAGNGEFKKAAAAQAEYLSKMGLPEVDCFINEFLPSYRLTLDEQE